MRTITPAPISPVIAALIERQQQEGLSHEDMAERLGIRRQYWWELRHGRYQPGTRLLQRIAVEFRDLKPDVWDFVMSEKASVLDK